MAKISFVTTVLNEQDSILEFLDSYSHQSKKADEVIIVDGGSSDLTTKLIGQFIEDNKQLNVKLLKKKGNRSVGRNTAIESSMGDVIVCSDVGCILDNDFVKNIVEPFSKDVQVVAGYYKPVTKTVFEKALASYTCVMPDKIDRNNFLPSSRSIAFKKHAWRDVGGYPIELDTCEDLVFAKRLKRRGFKFKFAGNALVYWPQKKNFKGAFWQIYNYAKGDGKALYIRRQTPLLFARYILGLILLALFLTYKSPLFLLYLLTSIIFYLIWSIQKNFRYVKDLKALIILPILQIISDIAVLAGICVGLKSRYFE